MRCDRKFKNGIQLKFLCFRKRVRRIRFNFFEVKVNVWWCSPIFFFYLNRNERDKNGKMFKATEEIDHNTFDSMFNEIDWSCPFRLQYRCVSDNRMKRMERILTNCLRHPPLNGIGSWSNRIACHVAVLIVRRWTAHKICADKLTGRQRLAMNTWENKTIKWRHRSNSSNAIHRTMLLPSCSCSWNQICINTNDKTTRAMH